VERVAEHWDRDELSDADRDRLYDEGRIWYGRYGVSDFAVPENRDDFTAEYERYCTDVLEPNPASDYLIEFIERNAIPDLSASSVNPLPAVLRPLGDWALPKRPVRMALAPPMRLVIFGGLAAEVRERFKIAWTRNDERAYQLVRTTIRTAWPYIPAGLKWLESARRGWQRELGYVPRRF